MGPLDVLYRLGDELAAWAKGLGASEDDLDAWHGFWVGVATTSITSRREEAYRVARQLTAAVRMLLYVIRRSAGEG